MYSAVVMYNIIMKLFHRESQKGFTAPELLIAIGMLALIFTITVTTIPKLRAKARDAQRVAVMQNIVAGLELFKKDHGYYFPGHSPYNHGWSFQEVSGGSCGSNFPPAAFPADKVNLLRERANSPCFLCELADMGYITYGY